MRKEFKVQLAEVEMTALRAQMNPHFLFNTMNSINHYILKKDPDKASHYLTKFSRLIRQVLNNSKSKLVSLDDELEWLRLYVEMEQMRFSNSFDFKIHIGKSIQEFKFSIPPLLLQPYVENAIWHGLMSKKEKGELCVSIIIKKNKLVISIRDNGIGRSASALLKSPYDSKKKSLGMRLTRERLNLINKIYKSDTNVEIIDHEENGVPMGTEVIISIPKMDVLAHSF